MAVFKEGKGVLAHDNWHWHKNLIIGLAHQRRKQLDASGCSQ